MRNRALGGQPIRSGVVDTSLVRRPARTYATGAPSPSEIEPCPYAISPRFPPTPATTNFPASLPSFEAIRARRAISIFSPRSLRAF